MDVQVAVLACFLLQEAEVSPGSDGEVCEAHGWRGAVCAALKREVLHKERERALQLAVLVPVFWRPQHAAVGGRKRGQKSLVKQRRLQVVLGHHAIGCRCRRVVGLLDLVQHGPARHHGIRTPARANGSRENILTFLSFICFCLRQKPT